MKILIISDDQVTEYSEKKEGLKKELEKLNRNKKTITTKYTKSQKYDLVIIFSDNLQFISNYQNSFKENSVLVILTQNLTPDYILNCIKITPYVCYSKNTTEYLVNKIKGICNKVGIMYEV